MVVNCEYTTHPWSILVEDLVCHLELILGKEHNAECFLPQGTHRRHVEPLSDARDDIAHDLSNLFLGRSRGPVAPGHLARALLGIVVNRETHPQEVLVVFGVEPDLADVQPAQDSFVKNVVKADACFEDGLDGCLHSRCQQIEFKLDYGLGVQLNLCVLRVGAFIDQLEGLEFRGFHSH